MANDRAKVLEMLENGTVSANEAAQLLELIGAPEDKAAEITVTGAQRRNMGRKLRVLVIGNTEKQEKVDVNVSIPLSLAKMAGNIVENCVPNEALSEMKKQGIDLKALDIGGMVDTLESLDEDIVNADIAQDEAKFRVRVYVD